MKNWALLFILSLSSVAFGQEYKRLHRTYLDLTAMDLSECRRTFRFINDNWMDCRVHLPKPQPVQPLSQITPSDFAFVNLSFPSAVSGIEAYVDVRDSARDYLQVSLGTHLILTMYYTKPGHTGFIEKLPAQNYTWPVFENTIRNALAKISQEKSYHTQTPMIALPSQDARVQDHIIDSVYVIKRKIPLDLDACRKSFSSRLVDAWPNEDYWVSECKISWTAEHAETLPLEPRFWSARLQAAQSSPIKTGKATLSYSAWGYEVYFDGELTWAEAENSVRDVFAAAGSSVEGYYILDERFVDGVGGVDSTVGKLIQNNGKLDVQ